MEKGADTQMHPSVAAKPKPPQQSIKPKPSLPRKPAVASKPTTQSLEKNGPNLSESQRQTPDVPEKVAPANQSSPSQISQNADSSRPKEPPPPLPKTAPKGSVKHNTPPTIHKTPPPGRKTPTLVHKALPSLPKTTPRTSVKHEESSPDLEKNDDKSVVSNIEAKCDSVEKNQFNLAHSEKVSEKDTENEKEDFTFSNLKSKFINSSENIAKVVPKVAAKPKPLPKDKLIAVSDTKSFNQTGEEKPVNKNGLGIKSSNSKSKWFVSDSSPDDDNESKQTADSKESQSAIHFLKGNKSFSDSTVWFNKSDESPKHSPKQSPIVPRKPPPRTPPKPDLSHSREDVNIVNDNFSSSNDSSPVKQSEKVSDENEKVNTKENNLTFQKQSEIYIDTADKGLSDSEESVKTVTENLKNTEVSEDVPKSKGSPKPPPKPVPRRQTPAVRPRPTPRKRLSLNRLSGFDETFGTDCESNMKYNEIKDKSELEKNKGERNEIDLKKDNEQHGQDLENTIKVDLSDRNDNDVVLRSFVADSGEEQHYRAIDKRKTKSHITELENETEEHTVILRRKITREENVSEEITIDQLKSIEHLLEPSDDEDDTHKFVPKVDYPLTDVGQNNTKDEFEVVTEKSKSQKSYVSGDDSDDLDDKALLEPSSLLNEIEDILTRSFKHSSLTRSGSSPEKKSSPYLQKNGDPVGRVERSKSVDAQTPVRPPRPKKEQKKLRSMSQAMYDSCGSDTESLPDMSRNRDMSLSSNGANVSLTLGKAKAHPPKPKRNKLLKVQRSQSDITAMKSIVEKHDLSDSKSPNRSRMMSEKESMKNKSDSPKKAVGSPQQVSWRKNRPTRKAPPPPQKALPLKVIPASQGMNLDSVVPLDSRVKSMNLTKISTKRSKDHTAFHSSAGPFYHSIDDGEVASSDGEHDYQDIPDDNDQNSKVKYDKMARNNISQHEKSASPPKLPPRNLSNSHSFDNSSLSSAGHDFDSAITGGASSTEDMSISSGCFEQDITSPGFKNHHIIKSFYPKTSSPYIKNKQQTGSDENILSSGLGPSNSSLSDSMEDKKRRPVSGCSVQSDSWSGSHEAEQSSSDSDLDDEEKVTRKKEKKLFLIAQEIVSSEKVFVDVLKLLNVDFRLHISQATEKNGRPVIPNEMLNRILDYLPQLQIFNEGLMKDLEDRIKTWEERKGIADIFVKKGPFLKLFSSYIRDFETITATYDEALKKYPLFQASAKEFELSPRCASLALKHYMLKPIQRIPQYRLLLQDYMKHLPPDCPEMKDMQTALAIVSEVATHANENMRHEDYVQKMLEIQRSLIGQFEVIKPGRIFLKEGELMKLSRKEMQPRYFFLFNDVLLYTTPVATGYRLNNVLPLAGMKVSVAAQDEYKMEFSIISVQRSFTLHGATLEERDDWVTALNAAIEENALKRNTFEAVRAGAQALLDKDFVLGHKAPLWIPDARVTMCMLCTCEFTVTWRRHHCRACGWVVCGNCSDCKAPLRYLKYKSVRVCDKCYKTLKAAAESEAKSPEKHEELEKVEEDSGNLLSLNGLFERFQKIRRSGRTEKKMGVRPERLKEVAANDQGASMSGYLQRWHKNKKWKRKWYLIKDMVLYSFKATQDTAAADSMVLLGYEVSRFTDYFEGVEADLLFQLSHANTDPVVFRTDSATATEKWVTVMREATVT